MEGQKAKVLIVDDSDSNRLVLRRVVEELDAIAVEAADGAEGLEAARTNDLALILLDLQMPTLDGFEATRLLRASPRTAHIPIIMITEVRVSLADQRHGLDLGAIAYLTRQNLDLAVLKEQIRTLLDLHNRAIALQGQINGFLSDSAALAARNDQIRALQDGLHRHLLLDTLTGLPNRMYFDLHLDIALKRAARGGRPFAVVWIDIDHLSRMVQRHGRDVGDRLLLATAGRMEGIVRASDVLTKLDGESYGLILDGITTPAEAGLALQKLLTAAGEPLEIALTADNSLTVVPTLSVGVAIYPRHGRDRASILQVAHKAAGDVLQNGGDGVQVGYGTETG